MAIGANVSLHLRNVTVRQILNAVTKATDTYSEVEMPLGWEYFYDSQRRNGQASVDSWKLLTTTPTDWKELIEEARKNARRQ